MCGILGIWAGNNAGRAEIAKLPEALKAQNHRGPDHSDYKLYSRLGMGHNRLAVIDTTEGANQPFVSEDERYCLVFNGEIYNYQELKSQLLAEGVSFKTQSDTEVLFHLLVREGKEALSKLNGFFAFAFYDQKRDELLLARDRMGIKPLQIYQDQDKIIFASELKTIFGFEVDKTLNDSALNQYFSLTYFPLGNTVLSNCKELTPGSYMLIKDGNFNHPIQQVYWEPNQQKVSDYEESKKRLNELLNQSVEKRLVSDVPIGSFLSGGLDSSIIATLAKDHKSDLETYSIGFESQFFDESSYAEEVAKKIGSKHYAFHLNQQDFKDNFDEFLDSLSEPFADSSAFAMFLLAKKTSQRLTVCLSGDGADELFAGYRKHRAEYEIRSINGLKKWMIKAGAGLFRIAPSSRSDRFGDFNRKLQKFRDGLRMDPALRYWEWCCFIEEEDRQNLLVNPVYQGLNPFLHAGEFYDLNDVLEADQRLVLAGDMLKKVDLMSMASALEVRTPFLDHELVEFVNSLPASYKINKSSTKRILRDTFANRLPHSVVHRSKKGFEIPIKEWLNDEIELQLSRHWFSEAYIKDQGIFNPLFIKELKLAWNNPRFGDKIYLVWALLVFQSWWDKQMK